MTDVPAAEIVAAARAVLAEVLGAGAEVPELTSLQTTDHSAVVSVRRRPPAPTLVLKLVRLAEQPATDLGRTAAVMARAAAAGVRVPRVLAADGSGRSGGWQYLVQEHVDGTSWQAVRPRLGPGELRAAHAAVAAVVVALQTVRLGGYGELDPALTPAGDDLVAALRRRARLRTPPGAALDTAEALLDRAAPLLAGSPAATLCHDDLHHHNVVFAPDRDGWRLAAVLDWDKAWAGPAEADLARLAFGDDRTGPGFWPAYRAAVPARDGEDERLPVHQLLWCLEHQAPTARHRADTARLCRRFGLRPPASG